MMPAIWLKYFRWSAFRSRTDHFVPQDERLLAVQAPGDLKPSLPEAEIAPDAKRCLLFPTVAFQRRTSSSSCSSMLANFRPGSSPRISMIRFVVEMRIGNEEDFTHINQYGVS